MHQDEYKYKGCTRTSTKIKTRASTSLALERESRESATIQKGEAELYAIIGALGERFPSNAKRRNGGYAQQRALMWSMCNNTKTRSNSYT